MRVKKLYPNTLFNHLINNLALDSRKVKKDDIFYAIKGENIDGNNYIEEAIYNGARTIVYQGQIVLRHQFINYIKVDNVRKQLANDAKIFYQNMTSKMKLVGVTGTNGKTTTTTIVHKILRYLGYNSCLIGTNGAYINENHIELNNTTPSIIDIYDILVKAYQKGVRIAIMEVSSHAIKMLRVYGLDYYIVLLTNITQDHLDFHKTFTDYLYTKGLFLARQKQNVIINKDIENFAFLESLSGCLVKTFGQDDSNYMIKNIQEKKDGTEFDLIVKNEKYHIETNLLAEFNVYNIVGALAILDNLNLLNKNCLDFFKTKVSIEGRMEFVTSEERTIVVDFSHTPDGVEKILTFLEKVKDMNIITVIGCGGNRDKEKRPIMGKITTELSDFVIFTSDNPRDEKPEIIIEEIISGCQKKNYTTIVNRKEAIDIALDIARKGDIVAILGKGNENYIIEGTEKIKFNDLEEVTRYLKENNYNENL